MSINEKKPLDISDDIQSLSFEMALQELQRIVSCLEDESINLDTSVQLYEKGQKLRTHCDSLLKAAEEKIEKIIIEKNNSTKKQDITDSL